MRQRPLYSLSLALLVTSAVTGVVAQRCAAQAATSAARAASTDHDGDRESFLNESRFYLDRHSSIATAALIAFVCGVAAWMWSSRRKESGLQSIPLLLTVSAALIQLLLV